MNKLFAKLFKRKDKKAKAIDLSAASDTGLTLILLRVPVEDLIKNCTQVSPQWNRILTENSFWRDKMDYDGYHLEWRKFKLTGISVDSFKSMALDHSFNRNFIMDEWDLDARSLTLDSGWDRMIDHKWEQLTAENVRTEIPPVFVDGEPEIPSGFERPIPACIGIHEISFAKGIQIRLAFEGLTDEIMDKFRPTIVVSEMVGNRRDCYYTYGMICALEASIDGGNQHSAFRGDFPPDQREQRNEERDENGRWIGTTIRFRFNEWDAERWHPVEHVFKDYPAGMRYLRLACYAVGREGNPADQCGLKLANCSVKALFEKNAPE